jgi:hypothetical protein
MNNQHQGATSNPRTPSRRDQIALLQGAVFLLSGVWPVVHIRSFEAVAGRKTDKWLVRTVGLLVAVIGYVLLRARSSRRITPEVAALAAGSAGGLAAIDFVYGTRGTIPRRYLLDGLMETAFVLLWLPHLGTSRTVGGTEPTANISLRDPQRAAR